MERYRNIDGDSGVSTFEIGIDHIKVRFKKTSKNYTYSYRKAGRIHVEKMKILARRGFGLNAYINQHVKLAYDQ